MKPGDYVKWDHGGDEIFEIGHFMAGDFVHLNNYKGNPIPTRQIRPATTDEKVNYLLRVTFEEQNLRLRGK